MLANFQLDWMFDTDSGAGSPEIAVTDIYLDLGTFISDFLGPILEEIRKVKRVIDKALPGAPHEVLLVLDGTIGQNAIGQVKAFDKAIGVTGLVITKLDGSAKGGVIAAIASEEVVATVAVQDIVALAAMEPVVEDAAVERVGEIGADDAADAAVGVDAEPDGAEVDRGE